MSSFEDRVQERRKQFKKGVEADDARRMREDEAVQLRKKDKDEQLAQKRKNDDTGAFPSMPSQPQPNQFSLSNLVHAVRNFSDYQSQFSATQLIRRQLSIEVSPPIQEVIDSGVVPDFIRLLGEHNRPDIQFEAAWALTNIVSGTAEQTLHVIEAGAIPIFVHLLESPNDDVCEQAVWALGNIAGDSARCRNLVLEANALRPVLEQTKKQDKLSMMRNATWTLSNFCRGKPAPDLDLIQPVLGALSELLYKTDVDVLTDSCWALSYFSEGDCTRIQRVIDSGVTHRVVALLSHQSPLVQTPALRVIGNIVTGDDNQTQIAIRCGTLQALKSLLNHTKKGIRKEACWTISNITAGNREQIQEVINTGLVPPLVELLGTADYEVKKEVCWAISNATSGGSDDQIQTVVRAGAIKPLCDILDTKDPKVILIALEALEKILKLGQNLATQGPGGDALNPYCVAIEEADGLDKIERLQIDPQNLDVSKQAVKVLELFPLDTENCMQETEETMNFGVQPQQPFTFG